jgi:Tol biopolymer transport system component
MAPAERFKRSRSRPALNQDGHDRYRTDRSFQRSLTGSQQNLTGVTEIRVQRAFWERVSVRAVAACVLVCLTGFLVACNGGTDDTAPERSTQPPRTGSEPSLVAFTVNRDGYGEIWLMNEAGGERRRLTPPAPDQTDQSGSTSPAWSPDGRHIAFVSAGVSRSEDPREQDIYVMNSDGGDVTRLTNDSVPDSSPAWSPDGGQIAFAHTPGLGKEDADGVIIVMNADGSGRRQLTRHRSPSGVVFDGAPAWSPDGTRIAFSRAHYPAHGGQPDAGSYVVDTSGEGEQLLVADGYGIAWSPDGTRIAFTSVQDRFGKTCFHECSPSGEIYVAGADGDDLRRLTRTEADDTSPTWSPAGTQIMFVSDRSDRRGHANEIYVMGSDGNDVRRLTRNRVWDLEPDWRLSR